MSEPAHLPAINRSAPELSEPNRLERVRFAWKAGDADVIDIERFEVARGERLFVAGPSGSGKSTLLSLVGGVVAPREGTGHGLERPTRPERAVVRRL